MKRLICKLRTLWYTIKSKAFWKYPGEIYISGHDYYEQEDKSLKCKTCGDVSV